MGGREEGRKIKGSKILYEKCSSMQVMTVRQDGIIAHTTEEKM